jgi:hypothetical protein
MSWTSATQIFALRRFSSNEFRERKSLCDVWGAGRKLYGAYVNTFSKRVILWDVRLWKQSRATNTKNGGIMFLRNVGTFSPDHTALHFTRHHSQYLRNKLKSHSSSLNARQRMIKELYYKPEGRGFETQWDEWFFFNLPNPSCRTRSWGLLRNEYQTHKIIFLG